MKKNLYESNKIDNLFFKHVNAYRSFSYQMSYVIDKIAI